MPKQFRTAKARFQWLTSLTATQAALSLEVLTLVLATVAFYSQDLIIIFNDALNNEATSYLLAIPILLAYLVYRKRKMLRASILETQSQPGKKRLEILCGSLLCTTAVLLYWYGSSTFTRLEIHMLTLPIFVTGLILILFNPQTLRQAAFPTAFLFLLVPPSSQFLDTLGSALSVASSNAANALVNLVGIPTTLSTQYGTPTITIVRPDFSSIAFNVDIACSGLYSLIGFLAFAAFITFAIRDKTWKKAVAFTLSLPLVYALNIIRITSLILIGYQWGDQLSLTAFHIFGGWTLIFLGTLILLVTSEKLLKTQLFTNKTNNRTCRNCNPTFADKQATYCSACGRLIRYPQTKSIKLDLTKVAAVALAAALLVSIQAPVYALARGPAQILIQTPQGEQGNTQILPPIRGYDLQFLYRDASFEQVSNQNLTLDYLYSPQQENGLEPVTVGIEIANSITPLHRWEYCLYSWPLAQGKQVDVAQLDLHDVQILQNPPVTARYFAYNSTADNQIGLILYWYTTAVFTINNTTQKEQVMLSLVTFPANYTATEQQLLPMAAAIAQYWQPIETWDTIVLFLSNTGLTLAATTATSIAAITIFVRCTIKKQRKRNQTIIQKLSKSNQRLLQAIWKTQSSSTATLNRIRKACQRIAGEEVPDEKLEQELISLEKTGLITRRLVNDQDSPVQSWQTDISMPKYRKG
jgi:exosortase